MKTFLSLFLVCLGLSANAATYYYNAVTTNPPATMTNVIKSIATNVVVQMNALTNNDTRNVTFIGPRSNAAYSASAGVVSNFAAVYGTTQTNTGPIQAQTGVFTGTGPSVFNNAHGISNFGTTTLVGNVTNSALTASRMVIADSHTPPALSSAAASGAVSINADGSATTFAQINALAPAAIATNGTWVVTLYMGGVQNIQLPNANRFASPIGLGATNLIQLVGIPLPGSTTATTFLTNLFLRCTTNNFSTTNYTITLLTNNAAANPVPTPVASLLTGTLLGATGIAITNFAGVSCIIPIQSSTVRTFGVMQIINSVALTTQPQSFIWGFEHWRQIGLQ